MSLHEGKKSFGIKFYPKIYETGRDFSHWFSQLFVNALNEQITELKEREKSIE